MAHIEKYTAQALAPMLAHYDRSRAANKDIDSNRTVQNYNLAPDRGNLIKFIDEKCCEIKCQKRKDVIKMCDWVITMPRDLPPEKESIFFSSTYDFLVNRYGVRGDSNIVSAFVHKDESQPHMHFAFIPMATEKKNKKKLGQLKVCAKDVITKADLQTFHGNLQDYLQQKLHCQVKILNEATKDGNRSIAELKRDSQRTDAHLNLLRHVGKDAERTKMGRGGLYGDDAVKMRVEDFNCIMELARNCSAESVAAKKLREQKDKNAHARAEADELAHQLRAEQDKRRAVEFELEKTKKRAKASCQADVCRLVSRVMDSGLSADDFEVNAYIKAVSRANAIKNAAADVKTINDGIRYKLKMYYNVNHRLDDDNALKVAVKAYYTYNGTTLDRVDDAIKAVTSVLPAMCCMDDEYRLQMHKKIKTYSQNLEEGIKIEMRKAEIKQEVKRKKLIITPNKYKDQDRSR